MSTLRDGVNKTMMTRILAAAALLLAASMPAFAQTARPADMPPEYPTVERMMNIAVENIGKRYNLSEEQLEKTREIMYRDVTSFLQEHHNDIWPLIRQVLKYQWGTQAPDSTDEAKRFGKQALPIFQAAKEAIYRGNLEWREYLTEDQKRVHDYDLSEMQNTFGYMEEEFKSWEDGRPTGRGIFPPAPQMERLPDPGPAPARLPAPAQVQLFNLDSFETIVDAFIKEYNLSEAQRVSARSIMTEYQGQARAYKDRAKSEFERVSRAIEEAKKNRDNAARKAAEAEYRQLLQPIDKLLDEMKDRLRAILTTAQVRQHSADSKSPSSRGKADAKETPSKGGSSKGSSKDDSGTEPDKD